MNSTSAAEVSIQAVSPELIFDESTENGAVGAAGAAASDAAAEAVAGAEALSAVPGAASAAGAAAETAAGAEASSATATVIPPASNDPAIRRDINNLRIFGSSYHYLCFYL